MEIYTDNYDSKKKVRRFVNVIIILLLILVVSIPVFLLFRLKTEGRLALREAKNVRLKLQTMDIEAYAEGKSVYDKTSSDGLSDGAIDEIRNFLDLDCDVRVTAYDSKDHSVVGFIYNRGRYEVIFTKDSSGNVIWDVNYELDIFDYDGE